MKKMAWTMAWRNAVPLTIKRHLQFRGRVFTLLLSIGLIALAACGGGSSGGGSSTPPIQPATITSVSVSCSSNSVPVRENSQCSATVSGTGNYSSTVTWSAVSGTVSSSGLYTAPASAPASGSDTIKATSTEDSTKSGTFTLAVQSQASVALQITTASLPNGTIGKSYNVTLAAEGGSGTGYIWAAPGFFSPLPGGFSLSSGGVLASTPVSAAVNSYIFPVQVTDSAGNTATSALSLIVQPVNPVPMSFILTDLHDFGNTVITTTGTGGVDGSYPLAGVTFDNAGNMYGTAEGGGVNGPYDSFSPPQLGGPGLDIFAGMVWELTASGAYKDLHDFGGTTNSSLGVTGPVTNANGTTGPDGWGPSGGVTLDLSGNMYGTTVSGGPYGPNTVARCTTVGNINGCPYPGGGMVWEITASGLYRDLHDFGATVTNANGVSGPDGASSEAGVTFDRVENMYGTTSAGGAHNGGIVWEITASGIYKDLHDFGGTVTNANGNSGPDGTSPYAGVTFDSSGNMYGTADAGGPYKGGLVWEITASGNYKDLHDFGGTVNNASGASGADGNEPLAGVTFDGSGNMYGTATAGGPNKDGMVWEIETSGTYKDLHDFGGTVANANGVNGPDGVGPYLAGVSIDSSGNLYGTTLVGGQYKSYLLPYNVVSAGGGIVWEITSSGTYKDLYDFYDGGEAGGGNFWPAAGVTLDNTGNIYGTTEGSYSNDDPVATMVWKLAAASNTSPTPSITPGGIVPVGSGGAVAASITPGESVTGSVTPGEWVSIYGSNLANATANWIGTSPNLANSTLNWTGNFPASLAGTSVTIGGIGAFLSYVSPSQIILQVPNNLITTSGPLPVVVTTTSGTATSAVTLTTFGAPSFLLLDNTHVAGIILRSNGSGAYGGGTYDIIGPTGKSLGYPTVAAKAGDNIELFAVGLGPTTAGQAWEGSALLLGNYIDILINNIEVLKGSPPVLSGSGLFQIALTVPAGLPTGDVPITAAVGLLNQGAVLTSPTVVISLQ